MNLNNNRELILFFLSILIIVSIPWYASGKSAFSLLLFEVLGGLQLFIIGLTHNKDSSYALGKTGIFFLFFLLVATTAYIIPIGIQQWQLLPGRDHYFPAIELLSNIDLNPWLTISLVPERTVSSLLTLLSLLALFLAIITLPDRLQKQLIILILMIAAIQGILGSIQFSTKLASWNFFTKSPNAVGTYLNRDHFVTLMYMTLPLAFALLSYNSKIIFSKSPDYPYNLLKILILALIVIVLISSAFFSHSRAGIILTLLAIAISIITFIGQSNRWKQTSLLLSIVLIALGCIMSIGIISAINRFIVLNPFEDGRWEIYENTLIGIKQLFPLGSGPGTYQEIYATIQPLEQRGFINHAHNDYLELIFEMGLFGIIIILLFLIVFINSWFQLRKSKWNEMKFIRTAAGIGIFLILLHSLVDFNLHTPANQVFFVVFLAVFLPMNKQILPFSRN